jgi:acetolactate synthase-1/2/3 large subunit
VLGRLQPAFEIGWGAHTQTLRAAYQTFLKPISMPGSVKLAEVVRTVSELLPEDAFISNGAGNYAAFLHRYFEYKAYRTQPGTHLGVDGLRPAGGDRSQDRATRIASRGQFPGRRLHS